MQWRLTSMQIKQEFRRDPTIRRTLWFDFWSIEGLSMLAAIYDVGAPRGANIIVQGNCLTSAERNL